MRTCIAFSISLLWSGCFLTGYETHEHDDASVDQMDAGLVDGGGTMDAQVGGDAGLDAAMDGATSCEVELSACGPIAPCNSQTCTCDDALNGALDAGPTISPSSYDCTFACGEQGNCRTFCREGELCQTLCLVDTPGCRVTCLEGSRCEMACKTNCRSECLAGATCNYQCIGGPCADVRCEPGAACTMQCPGTDPTKCGMRCDTGLKTCMDSGVVVCGTTCP